MTGTPDWLEDGEQVVLQRYVSLDKAQYGGNLYVTSKAVHFHCNVQMGSDSVHEFTDNRLSLKYEDLLDASVMKKFFIFNVLYLKPKEKAPLHFWFGVQSATGFEQEIRRRIDAGA